MAMAPQVEKLLAQAGARYQLVSHPRSQTSIQTADYADIPGDRLVKAVLLEDEQGKAYGLRMIVDSSLDAADEVYFEAGDHESLVRMSGGDFLRIIGSAPRVDFAVAERHATRNPLTRE